MTASYDAIVVGAGHNGLVTAGYLAKAGLSALVLEKRYIIGGACVTEEPWPGFKVSTAAYVGGLVRPKIIEDLQLNKFGLHQQAFDPQYFVPFPDGKTLFFWNDLDKTVKEIEKFSKKDAGAYVEFSRFWEEFSELVEPTLLSPPPNFPDLVRLFDSPEAMDLLRKVMFSSVKMLIDEYFESEYVKAALCTQGVIGTSAGPMTPGTAYIMAHHLLGDIGGVKGVWGRVRGGMGGITQSMARAAEHYGAKIVTNAGVRRITVKEGTACGVELEDGRRFESKVIVSNADPKRTFLRLVGSENLEADFVRRVEWIKTAGISFKINCALDQLPDYNALPGQNVGPQHRATVGLCPSVEYLEKAFDDAKYGRPSTNPFLESFIQSVEDPSVAPPGKHSMSITAKYGPYHLREGSWDDLGPKFADRVIEILAEYAPNIRSVILHRQVVTPLDLEREFSMTEGDIFHMKMTPDQVLSFRPVPGWANYRTPIRNLYLCGSGTHPGGAVTGAPGHNAARAVLEDWKKLR